MTDWRILSIARSASALALLLAAPAAIAGTGTDTGPADQSDVGEEGPRLMSMNLRVTNLEKSIEFYEQVLGLTEIGRVEFPHLTEVVLNFSKDFSRAGIILLKPKDKAKDVPIEHGNGYARSVFRVPELQTVIDRLEAAGQEPGKIFSHGPYRIMIVTDPDGYQFEIVAKNGEDEGHNHD